MLLGNDHKNSLSYCHSKIKPYISSAFKGLFFENECKYKMTDEQIVKIEKRIKILGLKKSHVAKKIDVSTSMFSHLLAGNRKFQPDQETKLLNYLGI